MKFKEMDTWSKVLFIVGVVDLIRFIITIIEGINSYAYADILGEAVVADLIDLSGTGMSPTEAVQLSSIVVIVVAIFGLLIGCLSVRTAKGKGKGTIPMVVMTLYAVIYFASILFGRFYFNYICACLLNVAGAYSCYQIKKKRKNTQAPETL